MLLHGVLLILLAMVCAVEAVDIRWTPGSGPKPMPFSKKYRDKHGGGASAGASSGASAGASANGSRSGDGMPWGLFALFCAAFAYWLYSTYGARTGGGRRLDSTSSPARPMSTQEQSDAARQARLARFSEGGAMK